jgi:hypothetical protein
MTPSDSKLPVRETIYPEDVIISQKEWGHASFILVKQCGRANIFPWKQPECKRHVPTFHLNPQNMHHSKHNNESSFQCEANKFGNFRGSSTYPS